jgi:hypothetical protein
MVGWCHAVSTVVFCNRIICSQWTMPLFVLPVSAEYLHSRCLPSYWQSSPASLAPVLPQQQSGAPTPPCFGITPVAVASESCDKCKSARRPRKDPLAPTTWKPARAESEKWTAPASPLRRRECTAGVAAASVCIKAACFVGQLKPLHAGLRHSTSLSN